MGTNPLLLVQPSWVEVAWTKGVSSKQGMVNVELIVREQAKDSGNTEIDEEVETR